MDIRWIQRFSNYTKVLNALQEAVKLAKTRDLSRLEKQGLVQGFEYTYELAWKTLKDFLENHGVTEIFGAKDVIKEAFKLDLITKGDLWMEMIKSRNQTSLIYDEKQADEISDRILKSYFSEFLILHEKLNDLKQKAIL